VSSGNGIEIYWLTAIAGSLLLFIFREELKAAPRSQRVAVATLVCIVFVAIPMALTGRLK